MSDVTRLLDAADDVLPLVYNELRQLATARLANEQAGHTLQPTALVHEAYLRLVGGGHPAAPHVWPLGPAVSQEVVRVTLGNQ